MPDLDDLLHEPDLPKAPALRWGILGPGWIATRFVAALDAATEQQVVAVASRDLGRATDAAEAIRASSAFTSTPYGSYADLVAADDVDVVYVATPHPHHLETALLAIRAGKHVVVEKPLATNAADARVLADAARDAGVFLMEAFWTMFLPKYRAMRRVLDSGVLGAVRTFIADNGESFEPGHRILDPDLAGGPLLDLGTYPFGVATWVLGRPHTVVAVGGEHPGYGDGPLLVNGQITAGLAFDHGAHASITASILADTPVAASIDGVDGRIDMSTGFYMPGDFTVTLRDGRTASWREENVRHDALWYQAEAAARAIGDGLLEHPDRPVAASVLTLETMDRVREAAHIQHGGG